MQSEQYRPKQRHFATLIYRAGCLCLTAAFALSVMSGISGVAGVALAAPLGATAPSLGAASGFSALGKAGVTNSGNSTLSGSVGADNPAAITGFPPGSAGGGFVSAPAVNTAESDVSNADNGLTSQAGSASAIGPNLTGVSVGPGVYSIGSALLPGTMTLNGPGVYVFLVASDLTSSGSISLINGAAPCNVFWHVTSSAAINGGAFVGTIIAGASVTFGNGASLNGRALAKTGNVTLINNNIGGPSCAPVGPTSTPTSTPTATASLAPGQPSQTPGPTATPLPTSTAIPTFPSHVSVTYPCSTDGTHVVVSVGLSAGVIVYGLGDDITSAVDTGDTGRIVRVLPFGHYDWHAVPPANHYMLDVAAGAIDPVVCPSITHQGSTGTPPPGSTASPTAGPAVSPTGVPPVLIAVTGADLVANQSLAAHRLLQGSLGFLGLGLVLMGVGLWRKRQ